MVDSLSYSVSSRQGLFGKKMGTETESIGSYVNEPDFVNIKRQGDKVIDYR